MLLVGSVKLDQIFRGTPNSPVSLLNKSSICSTGLTPKVSENLSYTTFTIDKDNSLTLTPVPKPTASVHGYYDEPKFHKVEFTPRSTPGLERMSGTVRSESVAEDRTTETETPANHAIQYEKPKIELEIKKDDGEKSKRKSFDVFVPKAHKSYEEYMPDMNAYTEPNRAESRCSLKSPSEFLSEKKPLDDAAVVQERSLPVKTLIDTFEHNNRPVMRYLQLEERVPLSEEIRRLHDDRPKPVTIDDRSADINGYYTADATVETRSFVVYDGKDRYDDNEDDNKSAEQVDESADVSGITDKSEFGDRSEYTDDVSVRFEDVRGEMKFQTIRQLATPDSLESSMLFAQKQSACDERQQEYKNSHCAPRKVPGKRHSAGRLHVDGIYQLNIKIKKKI